MANIRRAEFPDNRQSTEPFIAVVDSKQLSSVEVVSFTE